jgi:PKHD-type hydroxylase
MKLIIANILSHTELAALRTAMADAGFETAAASAGWQSADVKRASRARPSLPLDVQRDLIGEAIRGNDVFQLAAHPKAIIGPTFVRYRAGDGYGVHTDDPIIDHQRADLSFTLFLSDPAAYGGGELTIDGASGEESVKLAAGSLYLYPAGSLHRVEPVVSGERLVAVGWVRSYIRDAEKRELLFELDTARRTLFARHGRSHDLDQLAKSTANLVRMWCDD